MKRLSLKNSEKPQQKKAGILKRLITRILCAIVPGLKKKLADRAIDNAITVALGDHTADVVNTGMTRGFKDAKGKLPTTRAILRRMPDTESFSQRLARQTREKNLKTNQ